MSPIKCVFSWMAGCLLAVAAEKPNIVIFLADDMGFGDAGCYGHPLIRTPNIDELAGEGIRLTSFVTGAWCVPSRTQLMTGRYMPRVKFNGGTGADGKGGLPDSELTLAEGLRQAGYNTHMVGKWHLGYIEKRFLPVNQGFDTWFGLPYSNDFMKPWVQTDEPLGLYRGENRIEDNLDQDALTTKYTEEAVGLIEESGDDPFFLYLSYAMPHLPLAVSKERRGKSAGGIYGDVIEELDWSVGEVLAALEKKGIAEDTIVVFLSDNGPWTNKPSRMLRNGIEEWHSGSAGLLRGWKSATYEGGPRVPAIIRWPGKVQEGRVSPDLVGMPDIYRTVLQAGGAELPSHKLDGYDLTGFLGDANEKSPRSEYYYFLGNHLEAIRLGDWKLRTASGEPELFNLVTDPSERINRASDMPEKVSELRILMEGMAEETGWKVKAD